MWSRIFGRRDDEPEPGGLRAKLAEAGFEAGVHFRGDDLGWTAAEIHMGEGTPVYLQRFLTEADDLRGDLNTWAAVLETCDYSPHAPALMEKVIQSRQLITLRKPIDHPDDSRLDDLCDAVCRWLAHATEGIYQVDGAGWYDAQGMLLVEEY